MKRFSSERKNSIFQDKPLSDNQPLDMKIARQSKHTYSCLTMFLVLYIKLLNHLTVGAWVHYDGEHWLKTEEISRLAIVV